MDLKRVKGIFIKSEETESTSTPEVQTQAVPTNDVVPQAVNPMTTSSISADPEIVAKLLKVLKDKNLPGPDYMEIKDDILPAFDTMNLTVDQKLQAAFNLLKKQYPNFSMDIVLNSIDTYIGYIREEEEKGMKDIEKMRLEKIEGGEKEIADYRAKAEQLKQEYENLLNKIDEKTATIATDKIAINSQEVVFKASIDQVIRTLSADKAKLSTVK